MDDVFEFLQTADEQLEKHGNAIEAATKYYEAVYLMRQYLSRIPTNRSTKNRAIHDLLQEKIAHYENVASTLLRHPPVLSQTNENSTARLSDKLGLSHLSSNPNNILGKCDDSRSPLSNSDNVGGNWTNQSSPTSLREQRDPSNILRGQNLANPGKLQSTDVQYLNQQASILLSQAIDDDERIHSNANTDTIHKSNSALIGNANDVISKYLGAAELYLKAIQKLQQLKKCSNSDNKLIQIDATMKQRLQQTLDRVEVLKQRQQQHSSGTKASVSSRQTEDEAATKSMTNLLLTADEVQILKQSSLIASGLFLPWSDDDASRLNIECCAQQYPKSHTMSQDGPFTDPDGFLTLSAKQKERFYAWARPNEILRIRQQQNSMLSSLKLRAFTNGTTSASGKNDIVVMRHSSLSPYAIQQKYITDCSFIASLCICANYERKFQKPLVTSILYPQSKDANTGMLLPMYNPNGKYMIKLWLNGIPRCVMIDDYLPIDKHGNLLCSQTASCTTSNNRLELWVSLIEKAYMKLCGGYNFPGSNSGIDLFSLTGWIPEQIYFASPKAMTIDGANTATAKDHETPSERVWERIYSASSYGDCLITVSTLGDADSCEEKVNQVGLVSGHAYAVLSVIQTTDGIRLLQLKNPWAQQSWKGRYSCYDTDGWSNPKLCEELRYDPIRAKKQDDGVFWICWDDILFYFQDFFLSWNPTLFSTRRVLHGHWPQKQGPTDDTFNIGENPQYTLTLSDRAVQKKATIWILISRHVTKQEQEGEEVWICVNFAPCITCEVSQLVILKHMVLLRR